MRPQPPFKSLHVKQTTPPLRTFTWDRVKTNARASVLYTNRFRMCQAVLPLLIVTSHSAAATFNWTGDGNNAWGDAGNWTGTGTPAASDDVIYYDNPFSGDATYAGLNNATTGATQREANSITFGSNIGSDFQINPRGDGGISTVTPGHYLNIKGGGIDVQTTSTITLQTPVALGANQPWNVISGGLLRARKPISGSGILTKTGDGTLVFSPASSQNTTRVDGGTLRLYNSTGAIKYWGRDVEINNGSLFEITDPGPRIVLNSNQFTFDGGGAGTLNLSGNIIVQGNTTTIRTTGGAGHAVGGSSFNLQNNPGSRLNFDIADDGTAAVDLTLTSNFSGGSMTKTGAGTLLFPAAKGLNGTTTISGGTLVAGNSSGSATGTSNVTLAGGDLVMNAGSNIALPAGKEFSVGSGSDLTQTDTSTWTMDLFRVSAASASGSIEIADMPNSVDGDSNLMFSPGQGGMNGIQLTSADPFAQAGGLAAWGADWKIGIDPRAAMAESDFIDYTLFTSSTFDLTTLFSDVTLVGYSASTDDFWEYEDASNGDLIKIQSGNSLATYQLNVSSTEISVSFLNVFSIPEPSTLMLIGMGIPTLLLRRRLMRK